MNVAKLIARKRDGHALTESNIEELVQGYVSDEIPDYQMAALAMAILWQGMTAAETTALTRAMLVSGDSLSWQNTIQPVVDKHSTGGIGDKVSIVLAPTLAACGLTVPMISGRGLGATGGTLDKLESIPGFRTDLTVGELQAVAERVGCVICGASEEIAPADRKLYALRDVTATVPSIPLITASILSKKLAEGLDALILDVKWGSGSFMKTRAAAKELAKSLVAVAQKLGVNARALVTDMNQPLGEMVGNAVEVDECVAILQGGGPTDVLDLTIELGAQLLQMTALQPDLEKARETIRQSIRSGAALNKLHAMIDAQGGKLDERRTRRPMQTLVAAQSGFVQSINSEQLGWAIIELGGGRRVIEQQIDHSVGVQILVRIGQRIQTGQPIMHVFCRDEQLHRIQTSLVDALMVGDQPVHVPELIVQQIDS